MTLKRKIMKSHVLRIRFTFLRKKSETKMLSLKTLSNLKEKLWWEFSKKNLKLKISDYKFRNSKDKMSSSGQDLRRKIENLKKQ